MRAKILEVLVDALDDALDEALYASYGLDFL